MEVTTPRAYAARAHKGKGWRIRLKDADFHKPVPVELRERPGQGTATDSKSGRIDGSVRVENRDGLPCFGVKDGFSREPVDHWNAREAAEMAGSSMHDPARTFAPLPPRSFPPAELDSSYAPVLDPLVGVETPLRSETLPTVLAIVHPGGGLATPTL